MPPEPSPLDAGDIPWDDAPPSGRDRSLVARLERAIETGACDIEPESQSLAAVRLWLQGDSERGDVREVLPDLAALDTLTYEEIRGCVAKRAGIRTSILDGERDRQKSETGTKEAAAEESDAAPEHFTLADTLDAAASFLRRYIVFADGLQVTAVALWVAHTYVSHFFDTTPYLNVGSAQPECGKSRLLEVVEPLVSMPWLTGLPSEAVLYRKIAADRPTLLLDENDPIWKGKGSDRAEGLRAILNMGNRRGATVPRCVGDDHAIQEFPVFCPKALAGVGDLPDTLASRSIRVELKRKLPGEHVERFRRRDVVGAAAGLAASLRWHTGRLDLAEVRPKIPDELTDRAADGWEPLFAIADAAGGNWPEDARDAAKALSVRPGNSDGALSIRLLADIKDVFAHASTDRIFSRDLLAALAMIEDAPWGEMPGRSGRPLSAHALGRLLRPYGISSRDVRIPPTNGKGFLAEDFVDVWARYTSETTPEHRSNGDNVTNRTADGFQRIAPGDSDPGCHRPNGDRAGEHHRSETGEVPADTDLSPCHRLEGTADREAARAEPSPIRTRFEGLSWQQERAARLREIRAARRDEKAGAVANASEFEPGGRVAQTLGRPPAWCRLTRSRYP